MLSAFLRSYDIVILVIKRKRISERKVISDAY